MGLTPSPCEEAVAEPGRVGLVAVPQGVLLLESRPVWRRGAIGKQVVISLLVPLAIYIFALVTGPSGSLLALVGMLWLSPWLALTAGRSLPGKARTGWQVLRHRLQRRAARRRLRQTQVVSGSLATVAGGSIRVRGWVLEGPGFASASGRERCVLACYAGLVGGRRDLAGQVEVHAMPSCLLLVGDHVIEVALDGARYLEHPPGMAPRVHEQTIAVGDEVEVLGNLVRTIDQATGGYRTPLVKLVLAGDDRRPLLVRRRDARPAGSRPLRSIGSVAQISTILRSFRSE